MREGTRILLGVLVAAVVVIGAIYYFVSYKPGGPSLPLISQPAAPTANTSQPSAVYQSAAVLNGSVNPNGAQTSFWYEYGRDETLGGKTAPQLLGAGYTELSAPSVIAGLAANTTYYYRITAQNQYGTNSGAIVSFTTTTTASPAQAGIPPVIQAGAAANITETGATLNGAVNSKGYQTYYWFEYGKAPSLGNVTSVVSAGSGSDTLTVTAGLSGLESNTTYYYRLNAENVWGVVNSPIFSFTTAVSSPPPPPQGQAPSADTDLAAFVRRTTATLRGFVNPNGTATMYWFEYGQSPLPGSFELNNATPHTSAGSGTGRVVVTTPLSGLASSTTYYYRVVAENQYGKNFGAILNFTTTK